MAIRSAESSGNARNCRAGRNRLAVESVQPGTAFMPSNACSAKCSRSRAGQDLDRSVGQQLALIPRCPLSKVALNITGAGTKAEAKRLRQPKVSHAFPHVVANNKN